MPDWPIPDWMGVADIAAVLWFLGLWTGYTWYADKSSAHERSITAAMNKRRLAWMMQALNRDLRIVDTNILGNLLTGVGFFASTTIFVLGGLMAMLGVAEQGTAALARLPFASTVQETIWEVKILFLLLIFIYAFFKFTWAFRLANYCSITVGTMPNSDQKDSPQATEAATMAATLTRLSGHHFNRGLRAYFFALAALGWLISPWVFAAMTAAVVWTLYRREFSSRAVRALRDMMEKNPPPPCA
jgi:uncharacterized membrane protein